MVERNGILHFKEESMIDVTRIKPTALYDVKETATLLNKSPAAVRRLIRLGRIKGRRLGSQYLISGKALLDYLGVEGGDER